MFSPIELWYDTIYDAMHFDGYYGLIERKRIGAFVLV